MPRCRENGVADVFSTDTGLGGNQEQGSTDVTKRYHSGDVKVMGATTLTPHSNNITFAVLLWYND
jgi:hypothetical protein